MDGINLLGTVAGTLTTIAFIPQVLKTWRTKSGADLSSGMLVLLSTGLLLWLLYGIGIGARPVIIANAVTLVLVLAVLALKQRYGRR